MTVDDLQVDKILISKPRKSEHTYICPIYYESKKEELALTFEHATIISIKPLQQRNETFIYMKCKTRNNLMYDINTHIVDVVKEKSIQWFNNNMNTELIEDYYTNTLVYDKTHGDVIRLKVIGDESVLKEIVGTKVSITCVFEQLRIYKQKFVLECHVTNVTPSPQSNCEIAIASDIEDVADTYEDDVPSPNEEDIKRIKDECLEATNKYLIDIKTQLHTLEYKIQGIEKIKSELLKTTLIDDIIRLCNDLENICD